MKTQIKKISLIVLSAAILSACNSGQRTNSQSGLDPKSFSQQYKMLSQQNEQSIDLNLYNSIFISPDKEYKYEIRDLSNQLINSGSGELICKNAGECLIPNITVDKDTTYLVSIFDKSNGSFVGGTPFYVKNALTYMELSIDDISTSNYISQLVQQHLQDQFSVTNVENRLFSNALNYKKNVSISDLVYAYYNFLITAKNKSHNDAIDTISKQYKDCEQSNVCNLDVDFIKNEQSVTDVLNKANTVIETYAKDKKDSSLYENYKWFKENLKDNFDKYSGTISSGVDFFFPGSGGKVTGVAGAIFNGIETIFGLAGLSDSKAAYERIQLFNNNLSKYYVASIPNYSEILTQLGAQLLSLQVRKDFLEKGAYAQSVQQVVNNNLANQSILEFINSTDKNSAKEAFEWIAKAWDINSVASRKANVEYISDEQNIAALATAYKQIIKIDKENNVNNIKNRKYYNQLLIVNMQDAISALQSSMYLDALAIVMKDKKPDFKGGLNPTQISVSTISLSGTYDTDMSKLKSYYAIRLNNLKKAYQNAIVAEKAFVADNVLQTLETEGKCTITGTDGLNNLTATCPYYYKDGNIIKTKYITSVLDKPTAKCLTINNDASGDITQVSDVRNVAGTLQCMNNPNKITDKYFGNVVSNTTLLSDFNSGNSWYWNNDAYFYPDMRGGSIDYAYGRNIFMSTPSGQFRVENGTSTGNYWIGINQYSYDTRHQTIVGNTKHFYDNYNNLIGIFYQGVRTSVAAKMFNPVVPSYDLSFAPMYSGEVKFNNGNITMSFNHLAKPYQINVIGSARGYALSNGRFQSIGIDWLYVGSNPDNSLSTQQIPGSWSQSCSPKSEDSLSNGYWAVSTCKDSVNQWKTSIAGNGRSKIEECKNDDGILSCKYDGAWHKGSR